MCRAAQPTHITASQWDTNTGRVTETSQAAVAPTAAPGEVPGEGEVVLLLLLTLRALCTVRPTAGTSAVRIVCRLPVPAGLAAARV